MKRELSRRFFLTTALGGLATTALAGAPVKSLRPHPRPGSLPPSSIETLLNEARLNDHVGFAVADVKTGLVLESFDGDVGRPPASVAKTLTALYALDILGENHRFVTRLLSSAQVKDGVLQGDLVLAGGGDPTLDTDALAEMAADLKAAGLREVRGRFLVWEGALPRARQIDSSQPEHVGYNPCVSGIALNYNRVHFEWHRTSKGYDVTMEGRSAKYRPAVSFARMKVVARRGPVYTYEDKGGRDNWTVARGALGKGGARWLPVRRSGLYAGDVFQRLATLEGIKLPRATLTDSLPDGRTLVRHRSAELDGILRDMLKWSNNLTAEMVGLSATKALSGEALSIKASAQEMNNWAAATLGMNAVRMIDHSGLGGESRIAPAELVRALVKVSEQGHLKPLLKKISLRDDKGRPMQDSALKVRAKTGTLNFVSGLAGYITAVDGTEMAFAIFAADEKARAAIPRAERESPRGTRGWLGRARHLQQELIKRWGALYGV